MNDMFTFERTEWELLLDSLRPGDKVSAMRLLSALEAEEQDVVDEVLEELNQRHIALDIAMLPEDFGSGEMEKRLRFEANLPESGRMVALLDESDPLRLYLEEMAAVPAQGDSALLAERLLHGDGNAADLLLNLHLHYAVDQARSFTGKGMLLLDLIQEASVGLWRAIKQYTGGELESQIQWWIRQTISCAIFVQARENGVLSTMKDAMEAFRSADRALLAELGRNATTEEIALRLGKTPEQVDLLRDMVANAAAMEKVKAPEAAPSEEDEQPVENTAYFQSRQMVDEMMSALTSQEAQVIALRFGLEGGAPLTAEAVGEKLGLSAEAVVAIEAAALEKMRRG